MVKHLKRHYTSTGDVSEPITFTKFIKVLTEGCVGRGTVSQLRSPPSSKINAWSLSSSTPPSSPRPPPTHSYCCIMFCLELPLPPYPYPPITSTKTTSHTHTHLDHHIPSTSTINIIIIVIITNFYLHIHQLNQPKHLKILWQRFHPNALLHLKPP